MKSPNQTPFATITKELENLISKHLTAPLGEMFTWKFGLCSRDVEKIDENTFEIHDTSNGWTSVVVDGDTLINLIIGKESLLNLKFQ